MADNLPTTWMNLPNPIPGVSSAPQYALDIQNCFVIVDQHNHSGVPNGQQIQPSGLNINGDLSFQSNSAIALKTTTFTPQVSALPSSGLTVGCLYVVGNELYYNDATGGNQVPITLNGSVIASSSGITNGTASATFPTVNELDVKATSTNGANIKVRNLILTNNGNYTNTLTLEPPSLSSSLVQTLPTTPASLTSFMQMDSAGVMLASIPILGSLTYSNLSTSAGILGTQLANNTITATQIANATITGTQIAATTILAGNISPATITAAQISVGTITGTQITNNVNLAGNTVQENGKNVVVSNTNSATSLSVISIGFNSGGSILYGTGATMTPNATGDYIISFTTAFAAIPAVTVTPIGISSAGMYISSINTTTCEVLTFSGADTSFNIIAIGQRA